MPEPVAGPALFGLVSGGQQAIANSRIQLYAAGTAGDASAATPLLTTIVTTSDGSGDAFNKNANAGNAFNSLPTGSFTISDGYQCPSASSEVYLSAVGGNPGLAAGTDNHALSLMTAIGACGDMKSTASIQINERTTVGSIVPLSPFMGSYSTLGSSIADRLPFQDAMLQSRQYTDIAVGARSGSAMSSLSLAIQTLADVLSTCILSAGGDANDGTACGHLFALATPAGGAAPTDTVGAALNILKHSTPGFAPIEALLPPGAPPQTALANSPPLHASAVASPGSALVTGPPIILNETDSAVPNDVVFLQGDNFGTSPQVYFYTVGGSESSLASPTTLGATLLTPVTASNQAVTVQLPSHIPMGLYALWVSNAGSYSAPVLVNQARGMQFEFGEVSPGYVFRIFGRNLSLSGATPTVTFVSGSSSYAASVVTAYANDGNVLQVTTPAGIVAGTVYTVKVSNGFGHGTGNYDVNAADQTITGRGGAGLTCSGVVVSTPDVFSLGVPWGTDFACVGHDVINVVTSINPHTSAAYGADPSGAANSVNAIQQALYDAGNTTLHPNGATVLMPAGTFSINYSGESTSFYGTTGSTVTQPTYTELQVPSKVVLSGTVSGTTLQTTIQDATNPVTSVKNVGITNVTSASLIGLTNFIYQQSGTVTSTATPPIVVMNGSEAFISNVAFHFAHSSAPQANGGNMIMGGGGSHDILAQTINLDHGLFAVDATVGTATYGIVRNNVVTDHGAWYRTRVEVGGIQNMLIEGNTFTRDGSYPGSDAYEQGGLEGGPSPYVTVLNNTFNAVNLPLEYQNDGETILVQTQSALVAQTGTASSATSTTLTDSSASFVPGSLVGEVVSITSGTGSGSSATVTANTATVITIGAAWATTPASGSHYSVNVNSFDYGAVSAATATTLTGVSYSGHGTAFPTAGAGLAGAAAVVEIIGGPGLGQVRYIASNTVNTITVTQPWAEIPTTASIYAVTGVGADRWLVKGNVLSDQPRGIVFYTGSHDCVVTGNTLVNMGETIYLRGDQRPLLSGGGWNGRFNPTYKTLVADNVLLDTNNTRAAYAASTFYPINDSHASIVGTAMLGQEYRRNVQQGYPGNTGDGATAEIEGYANDLVVTASFTDPGYAGLLGTIFDDNYNIDTANGYHLSTGSYQTTIWDPVFLNGTNLIKDDTLTGAGHASTGTVQGADNSFAVYESNFSGTGTSTGPGNLVGMGGTGQLLSTSGDMASILSTTPFDSLSGSYLHMVWTSTGNAGGGLQTTPISPRSSWQRIFDQRSQQWIVNGAFDFFMRPAQDYTATNDLRAIDIGAQGTNSLRMVLLYTQPNEIQLQLITPSGGGGTIITGTYSAGFTAGTVYHLGMTFSTDMTHSPALTTAKIFVAGGTGAITTSSATNLIGSGTFSLIHSVVNDTSPSSWFNGGPWLFGGGYGPTGVAVTNDYDGLQLYYTDPGTFPPLDSQ